MNFPDFIKPLIIFGLVIGIVIGACTYKGCEILSKYKIQVIEKDKEGK